MRDTHSARLPVNSGLYDKIYTLVRQIPRGRVATYGQISRILGNCGPRQVGYAMAAVRDDTVPWHRVINSQGRISIRSTGDECPEQQRLLEAEGVLFSASGRVNLTHFGWDGENDL